MGDELSRDELWEMNCPGIDIHIALIYYNKAFDSVDHHFMFETSKKQGVPDHYTQIIQEMYKNLKTKIVTEVEGQYFRVKRGVRQGDPLSPIFFNSILEETFRGLNWEEKGIT